MIKHKYYHDFYDNKIRYRFKKGIFYKRYNLQDRPDKIDIKYSKETKMYIVILYYRNNVICVRYNVYKRDAITFKHKLPLITK